MKRLRSEVASHMSELVQSGGKLSACFIFPEDFVGFEGHFPSKKILPGVCQIECVAVMIEAWRMHSASVREVLRAKYLLPVFPSDELSVECSNIDCSAGDDLMVKVQIKRGTQRVTELKLKIHLGGPKKIT